MHASRRTPIFGINKLPNTCEWFERVSQFGVVVSEVWINDFFQNLHPGTCGPFEIFDLPPPSLGDLILHGPRPLHRVRSEGRCRYLVHDLLTVSLAQIGYLRAHHLMYPNK